MRWHSIVFIVVLALLAALPLVGGNYALRLATIMLMYATLSMAWNFIGGFAGYPSFGTAAFFGLGAYAGAVAQVNGAPLPLAWLLAAATAVVFALLLGFAVLRLRGHAFAIATLVVAEVLREITNGWTGVTGGGMGLNLPHPAISLDALARLFFYAMLAVAAIAQVVTIVLARNRLGFGLRCIRQNEDAAGMVGVNTTLYKTVAFALSGCFAAAAGAVYASWTGYIEPPDAYDALFSIKPIVMVLLGGLGTAFGPALGAIAFLVLDELVWRNFLKLHSGILGALIVVLVLFLPAGLASFSWRDWFGRRKPA